MSRTMPRKLLLPLLASVLLNGCGMWGKEPDPTRGWSARQLYQAGKDRLDEGDYETALDYYGKLESRYPFGVLAEQAQLETAYAHYKRDEPASAIAAADRFLKQHPRHPRSERSRGAKRSRKVRPGLKFASPFR